MSTMKTILAAAIGIALATVAVNAFGATQDDEDSVYSWGPWAKMVAPAAGPQGPGFLNLASIYEYRPEVGVENGGGPCAPGAPCGFATYKRLGGYNYAFGYDGGEQGRGGKYHRDMWNGYVPAMFGLSAEIYDGWKKVHLENMTFNVVPLNGDYPDVTSLAMRGHAHFDWWHQVWNFDASSPHYIHGHSSTIGGVYDPNAEVAIGSDLKGYGDGWSDKSCGRCGVTGGEGAFVWGVTPTLDALQNSRAAAGGVGANYYGSTIYGGAPVYIHVELAAGTWNGSWGNGHTPTAFAFDANGTISGVNLTSTNVSGDDHRGTTTYSGTVNGAFFGTEAQTIAGVSDVTKTVTFCEQASPTTVRNVDLFVTGVGGVDK